MMSGRSTRPACWPRLTKMDAEADGSAGLVLAAGGGSRLGLGAKALLRSGGVTLVERAVGALGEGGCDPVLVVVGAQAEAVAARVPGAQVVRNLHWAGGLASSFRAGVAALPQEAARVVVTLVDQPGVGPQVVARLLRVHQPGRITAAAYAESGAQARAAGRDRSTVGGGYDGGAGHGDADYKGGASGAEVAPRPRHPMVFDAALVRRAAETARGDHGAREFLRANPGLLDLVDCSDLGSAADIDTAADLHLLEP